MQALFEGETILFTIPALIGTAVFLLKLSMMMIGGIGDVGDADVGVDVDFDVDLDVDADVDAVHSDSTSDFKLFSIQTVAAFLMGFGAGGLTAKFGFAWTFVPTMIAAVTFGVFMVWLITAGMKLVYDLQSSGNVDIRDAVGRAAVVYTRIPSQGDGRGSVRIVINERQRIYNAITEGDAIESQSRVRVTMVNGDNSVTVSRL